MLVIVTKRLKIYVASCDVMTEFISLQVVDELKKAYTQMLDGCLMHPEQWNWYAIWMIELKDGTHIGELSFKGIDENGIVEIGYGILPEYEGKGFATEAVFAAVDWAIKQPEVTRIEAETDFENIASRKVLEKCGFHANGSIGVEGPRFVLLKNNS